LWIFLGVELLGGLIVNEIQKPWLVSSLAWCQASKDGQTLCTLSSRTIVHVHLIPIMSGWRAAPFYRVCCITWISSLSTWTLCSIFSSPPRARRLFRRTIYPPVLARARAIKHDLQGVIVWYNVKKERDRWHAGDWQSAHEVHLVFSIGHIK